MELGVEALEPSAFSHLGFHPAACFAENFICGKTGGASISRMELLAQEFHLIC